MFATYNNETKRVEGLWDFIPPNNIPYVNFPDEYIELMGDLRYYFTVENNLVIKNENKEEIDSRRKIEITERLNQLSQDFIQVLAGAEIEDLEERRLEFQTLHNELRVLENKEPRKYS